MALDPDLPVLVPGELITAQYNNDQRSNLLRIDDIQRLPSESRSTALLLTNAGMTTTPVAIPNAIALGTRGRVQRVDVTAGVLLTRNSGTATTFDLYVVVTNSVTGTRRRSRFAFDTGSGFVSATFYVAAGVAGAVVSAQLGTSTATAVVSTTGGVDLNWLQADITYAETVAAS